MCVSVIYADASVHQCQYVSRNGLQLGRAPLQRMAKAAIRRSSQGALSREMIKAAFTQKQEASYAL